MTAKLGLRKVDILFLICIFFLINLSVREVTSRTLRDAAEILSHESNMTDDSVPCSAEESQGMQCLNGGECVKIRESSIIACRCPNEYEGEKCESRSIASFESLYMAKIYIPVIATALVGVIVFFVVFLCMKCRKNKRGYEPCKEETAKNTSPR